MAILRLQAGVREPSCQDPLCTLKLGYVVPNGGCIGGIWCKGLPLVSRGVIVPLKQIEYDFGYIIIRSPNTPLFYLLKGDYIR